MRRLVLLLVGLFIAFGAEARAASPTMSAPTHYVDVAGNKIAYRSIGQGSPIVLANRMRGTLDTWDPLFVDRLAEKHRVIIFDYPGTGYSQGVLPSEMSDVADFVKAFTAKIGLTRFAMAGWSWGGYVTQTVLLEHPEVVTHAVLIGTNPPGENQIPIQEVWKERALHPVNDLADEEILFFEPKSEESRKAAKLSRDRIYARPDVVSKIPSRMEEFQAFFKVHEGYRADTKGRRQLLKASQTPILILCGDNDISVPAKNWYPLIGEIPHGYLFVVPQSGHGPQHQYPELSARYIVDFIQLAGR